MTRFYFIILLLLFVLVLGMCIPNLNEAFTMSSYGEIDYYNWGLSPLNNKRKKVHHKQFKSPSKYSDGEYKCYYTPSQQENNFCENAMRKCPLSNHPDLNNYISKSMIPPQPNLNNYVLKSQIPPARCPPNKCPPHPDMITFKKYMKKTGKCPSCPTCPVYNSNVNSASNKKTSKKKKIGVKPSAGYEYV